MITEAKIVGNKLQLTIVMYDEPVLSSSKKTKLVATTHSYQPVPLVVGGLPVSVALNATIPNVDYVKTKGGKS